MRRVGMGMRDLECPGSRLDGDGDGGSGGEVTAMWTGSVVSGLATRQAASLCAR